MPPASDAPDRDEVYITAEPLPLGHLAARVVCPTAGAIATFIGTTRDSFEGKRVLRLEVCAAAAATYIHYMQHTPANCAERRTRATPKNSRKSIHPLAVRSTRRTSRWPSGRCG